MNITRHLTTLIKGELLKLHNQEWEGIPITSPIQY